MASDAAAPERAFLGLRDLDTAGKLATKRHDVETMRNILKREWALNREYYNGNQWAFWNANMLRVEALPVDSGPAWKVRLQSNQIKPGLTSYVNQLTKTRPIITAEPDSGSDTDVKAAQMATSLFESIFEDENLTSKTQAALMEAGLSGGYWKITWNALAGKPMTFTMDPNGQPILDEELAGVYVDQLTQELAQSGKVPPGQDPEELAEKIAKKTVYVGDIDIEVMSSENVLLDPAAATFEKANWAICRHSLDPDEIKSRWGKVVQPNAVKSSDVPLAFSSIEERKPMTIREVYVMYVRPCPSLPKGRYVVWIEGPDTILQDMPWPYPFRELPLVKFPGVYRPNSPYDDPVVSEVRPLQKDLNKTLSQIVEHKNLTVRPQILAPIGSLRSKLTTEPGAIFEYNPVGNQIPQWREAPQIPQYVFAHLADIQGRIDKRFNRMPTTRDQIPARADGGALLESMQEATSDEVSSVIIGLEDALARAGTFIAALAQEYYEEPRLLRIRGQGGGVQVKKFEAADIAGGFTFRPRYGSGLPRTRQGKQDAIMQLLQEQLIDGPTALKHLDLGDLKGVQAIIAADEDQAMREHDKMLRGTPVNPAALQAAQQALQQFQQQAQQIVQQIAQGQPVDLDGDGQPDPPQQVFAQLQQQLQQLQQQLSDAPWQPLDYENWESHIQTHSTYMKTQEYEQLDPQQSAIFLQHYNLTYQRFIDVKFAMPDPNHKTNVTVRANTTLSAPSLSKILGKSGIQTGPDELSQPALDTVVMDDLAKNKVDASGNTQLSQLDQAMATQQAQDAHVVAQAQAVQKMGLAEVKAEQEQAAHELMLQQLEQQRQQAEEMHQAKLQAQRQQGKD